MTGSLNSMKPSFPSATCVTHITLPRPFLWLSLLLAVTLPALASLSPERLRCEYLDNPLGIDTTQPRLSWVLESTERGQKQTAYQILVASKEGLLKSDKGDLWDTGTVKSDQTVQVVYAGKPLPSYQRCYWKVRVWDKDGKASAYRLPS
jgi:alpha-L-rhamnosidase